MTARFGPYVGPSPTFTAAPRAATVTSGFSLSSASVSISVTGAGALLHRTRSRVDAAQPVGAAGSGALSGVIGSPARGPGPTTSKRRAFPSHVVRRSEGHFTRIRGRRGLKGNSATLLLVGRVIAAIRFADKRLGF